MIRRKLPTLTCKCPVLVDPKSNHNSNKHSNKLEGNFLRRNNSKGKPKMDFRSSMQSNTNNSLLRLKDSLLLLPISNLCHSNHRVAFPSSSNLVSLRLGGRMLLLKRFNNLPSSKSRYSNNS